jgi:hypothetical protein
MAFDALRLRNVIQLAGILSVSALCSAQLYLVHSTYLPSLVFHLALVVFASIQIHETKTALVQQPNCDGSDDYVVCSPLIYSLGLENRFPLFRTAVARALYTRRWNIYSLPYHASLLSHGLS